MNHLAHLDLRRLCKLIWVLSSVMHQARGGQRAPKARCIYEGSLDDVAAALTNWPVGFRKFLSNTYDHLLQNAKEMPSFTSLFSWLRMRLIKHDEAGRSAFGFMASEVYRFGAQHWTRGSMARDPACLALIPEGVRWGTIADASEATGLHPLTIKKRIASGEINSRKIRKFGQVGIAVDLESIRSMRLTQYPTVSVRDAAIRIGVSVETLTALRASGVFAVEYQSAFARSLTHEDVEAFAERLRQLGNKKPALNVPGLTTLDDAFAAWTASPKEKAGLLARLLTDPTKVVGKKRGAGVGQLQVTDQMVSLYFGVARRRVAECLSVQKAAVLLGCTPTVITWLRRGGHLKGKRTHGRQTPTLQSVNAFDKEYEALARIARRSGTTVKSALARLDIKEIDHLKVKTKRYTTVFVHRKHAEAIQAALVGKGAAMGQPAGST